MNVGYCFTGSFCTFDKSITAMKSLVDKGYNVVPIMSYNAYSIDTRFATAKEFRKKIEQISGNEIICTIEDAEPIGPKHMFDVLCVVPCTSNTLAKLANGVNDTPVTMAVKSHLRNNRPVVIGVSTNDALGAAAKNIGTLLNYRCYYFVPMEMDNPCEKPRSLVCDFSKVLGTVECAINNVQYNPLFQ